jgi:hypothetical protein
MFLFPLRPHEYPVALGENPLKFQFGQSPAVAFKTVGVVARACTAGFATAAGTRPANRTELTTKAKSFIFPQFKKFRLANNGCRLKGNKTDEILIW